MALHHRQRVPTALATVIIILALWPTLRGDAGARTWSVSVDGLGDALTIQAGIDSASDGDIVLVGPGRYFENIIFKGKTIVVRSESGAASTIIDGGLANLSCVRFVDGEGHGSQISGFTITNGRGMPKTDTKGPGSGGGILIFESEPTVSDNVIVENEAFAMSMSVSQTTL